jgi:hypothetical protein
MIFKLHILIVIFAIFNGTYSQQKTCNIQLWYQDCGENEICAQEWTEDGQTLVG